MLLAVQNQVRGDPVLVSESHALPLIPFPFISIIPQTQGISISLRTFGIDQNIITV